MTHDEILMAVLQAGGTPNGSYYLVDDECFRKLLQRFSSYELKPTPQADLWVMWINTSNHVQYAREVEKYHGIE